MNSFTHEQALCETPHVGSGTRIAAFAHVLQRARIGQNCDISDHVFIGNDVVIGDDVTVQSGVQLCDGVRLANRVFVGSNATFAPTSSQISGDRNCGRGRRLYWRECHHSGRGANWTIGGRRTRCCRNTKYPRQCSRHRQSCRHRRLSEPRHNARAVGPTAGRRGSRSGNATPLGVGDCELLRMPSFADMRGSLAPLDFTKNLPFPPRRSFLVYSVPNNRVRGEHAHRVCHQLLVAAHGRLAIVVDDAKSRREVELSNPTTDCTSRLWSGRRSTNSNPTRCCSSSLRIPTIRTTTSVSYDTYCDLARSK